MCVCVCVCVCAVMEASFKCLENLKDLGRKYSLRESVFINMTYILKNFTTVYFQ